MNDLYRKGVSLNINTDSRTISNIDLNIEELLVPQEGLRRFPIYNFHSEEGFMKKGFSIEVKFTAIGCPALDLLACGIPLLFPGHTEYDGVT